MDNGKEIGLITRKDFRNTGGRLLAAPIRRRSLHLTQDERADIVVDFSGIPVGSSVESNNRADRGPIGQIMRLQVRSRAARPSGAVPELLSTLGPLEAGPAFMCATFISA